MPVKPSNSSPKAGLLCHSRRTIRLLSGHRTSPECTELNQLHLGSLKCIRSTGRTDYSIRYELLLLLIAPPYGLAICLRCLESRVKLQTARGCEATWCRPRLPRNAQPSTQTYQMHSRRHPIQLAACAPAVGLAGSEAIFLTAEGEHDGQTASNEVWLASCQCCIQAACAGARL